MARPRKENPRSMQLPPLRVTSEEMSNVEAAATLAGMTLTAWARACVLSQSLSVIGGKLPGRKGAKHAPRFPIDEKNS